MGRILAGRPGTRGACPDHAILQSYIDAGIQHVASVPCSITDTWQCLAALASRRGDLRLTMSTHEGNLVGIAVGSYFATGKPALVHMQNSGLMNAADGFISCANAPIYRIPMAVMITYRGAGPDDTSEPHQEIGCRTEPLIDAVFGDGAGVFGTRCGAGIQRDLEQSIVTALSGRIGVLKLAPDAIERTTDLPAPAPHTLPGAADPDALRVRHGAPSMPSAIAGRRLWTRDDAIVAIAENHPDAALLFCNGFTSRAARSLVDRPGNLYNVGYMGGTSAIGWALARERPGLEVVVVDGDQNALMSTMKDHLLVDYPPNLSWYILNNRIGASVGAAASLPLGDLYSTLARVVETVPDRPGEFAHPRVSAQGAVFDSVPPDDIQGKLASLSFRFRTWVSRHAQGGPHADR